MKFSEKLKQAMQQLGINQALKTMKDLAKEGVETDFLYEKDGVQGLWLEVKGVKSNV